MKAAVGLALLILACDAPDDGVAWLVLDAPLGSQVDLAGARILPERRVEQSLLDGAELLVAVRPGAPIRVEATGACPLDVEARELHGGATLRRKLRPWLTIGGATLNAGYGSRVELRAVGGCAEAQAGSIEWTQLAGPELAEVRVESSGRVWSATLPTLEATLGAAPTWGVVAISPRTSATVELEATWEGEGGQRIGRNVRIAASAPASGLPNVPLASRVLLGGQGWKLLEGPRGSRAEIQARHAAASELLVDALGDYQLADVHGALLELRAGRYDATPLDCERGGCHGDLSRAASQSPMTSVLARVLESDPRRARCALSCHATAGANAGDGGFHDVARQIGFDVETLSDSGFTDLPRALRRLSGVGCLACHGPGAIPAEPARWAILRSDVCATCHDEPPRYGHVAAWRASAMARSDVDPRARSEPACARCHTTHGFLHAQGALDTPHAAPDAVGPVGITCAACHAPHDPKGTHPRLVRRVAMPAWLEGRAQSASALCAACHAPSADLALTPAAGVFWAGSGGLDPATGAVIQGAAPHAKLGCVDCHRAGPRELSRGANHAFRVDVSACNPCHDKPVDAGPAQQAITARARALLARLGLRYPAQPLHAEALAVDRQTALGRAAYDVALVLEDGGAAAHGLAYANALLDAAERAIVDRGKAR